MTQPLTADVIEEYAARPGARRLAVENFLMTVHNNPTQHDALMNLSMDARLYGWSDETVKAIGYGIFRAFQEDINV